MIELLFFACCFLAYSNGANDNFKGVASLFGSGATSYRVAIGWATLATAAGSLTAIFFAQALLHTFTGKGLVPDSLIAPQFLLAVAMGAGATVILATLLGFPISTTHGLTGALVGAAVVTGADSVNFAALGKNFLAPLLFAPLLAVLAGAAVYTILRFLRIASGVRKELCVCVGKESYVLPIVQPSGVFAAESIPQFTLTVGDITECHQRYSGTFAGMKLQKLMDVMHFASAGAVSFARGLNDTPKIAALLLAGAAMNVRAAVFTVGVAMAIGGLLSARKVAHTMAYKITDMNPGQGFSANLTTALLVSTANSLGLPVSTTHASVGSLLGVGIVTRQAKWRPVFGIFISWVVTLPCAAVLAGVAHITLRTLMIGTH
jgi:PiT family inorganic phosphate transporter